jgi:hypothetical protein
VRQFLWFLFSRLLYDDTTPTPINCMYDITRFLRPFFAVLIFTAPSLSAKNAKFCTMWKFPAIRYYPRLLYTAHTCCLHHSFMPSLHVTTSSNFNWRFFVAPILPVHSCNKCFSMVAIICVISCVLHKAHNFIEAVCSWGEGAAIAPSLKS